MIIIIQKHIKLLKNSLYNIVFLKPPSGGFFYNVEFEN
jgi:hypothetical protein